MPPGEVCVVFEAPPPAAWWGAALAPLQLAVGVHTHRYQAAGEKLAVENFSLADELAKQKLTLQDINEFLTNELKARSLATAQASSDPAVQLCSNPSGSCTHTLHAHAVCVCRSNPHHTQTQSPAVYVLRDLSCAA